MERTEGPRRRSGGPRDNRVARVCSSVGCVVCSPFVVGPWLTGLRQSHKAVRPGTPSRDRVCKTHRPHSFVRSFGPSNSTSSRSMGGGKGRGAVRCDSHTSASSPVTTNLPGRASLQLSTPPRASRISSNQVSLTRTDRPAAANFKYSSPRKHENTNTEFRTPNTSTHNSPRDRSAVTRRPTSILNLASARR